MADSTLGLLFDIGADPSKAIDAVGGFESQAAAALQSFEAQLASTMENALGITKEFTAGMAVGVGAVTAIGAAMFELANKAAEAGSEIFEASEKTGLSAQSLSGLNAITKVSGENFDSLTMALARAGRNLTMAIAEPGLVSSKVLSGLMGGAKNLADLGLKPMDERIQTVLQRIFALNDAGERNAALQSLLGRGWMENVETLKMLAEQGYGPAIERAKAFGMFFDEEAARKAKQFGIAWKETNAELGALALTLGQRLIPVVNETIVGWNVLIETVKQEGRWNAAKGFLATLAVKAQDFLRLVPGISAVTQTLDHFGISVKENAGHVKTMSQVIEEQLAFMAQLTAAQNKTEGSTLNLGKAVKDSTKAQHAEMMITRLRMAQHREMDKVLEEVSHAQMQRSEVWLKELKKEEAAEKEFANLKIEMLRAGEKANRTYSAAVIKDMEMVLQEQRRTWSEEEAAAKKREQEHKQELQYLQNVEKEWKNQSAAVDTVGKALSSLGGIFGQNAALQIAAIIATAIPQIAMNTAAGFAALGAGDDWAAANFFLAAAEYGIAAGASASGASGGGGSSRAAGPSGGSSGGGSRDFAPSAPGTLAPGAMPAQPFGTVRMVLLGADAQSRQLLAAQLNQHVEFEGGRLVSSKALP